LTGKVGLELFVGAQQLEALLVERRGRRLVDLSERLALAISVEDGELRLRRAQRDLLGLERHTGSEDRVLELVVTFGELGRNEPAFAGLAQPVQPLALLMVRALLFLLKRAQLIAAEQVGVARDDRRLLRDLLFADANGPPFLRALIEVSLNLRFEFRGR